MAAMSLCLLHLQAVEGPGECVPKQWAALNPGKAHPNYTTLKNCPGLAAPKLPKQVGLAPHTLPG
jgi:hypothetical protein